MHTLSNSKTELRSIWHQPASQRQHAHTPPQGPSAAVFQPQSLLIVSLGKAKCFSAKAMVCCVLAIIAAPLYAQQAAVSREVAGVSMPKVIVAEGETLHLNGIGALKKYIFFKVYVVGLYLKEPMTDASATMKLDETKRIQMNMRRDVSRDNFVKAVESSIKNNYGPNMPDLRTRLDRLEKALPALKKGDALSFMYKPGTGTTMQYKTQSLTIPGKDFSDAMFSIWLGKKPVSESLKGKLLGGD